MEENIINLGNYRNLQTDGTPGVVIVGRENGIEARKHSKIDKLIEKYDKIMIFIPGDICSINASFLEQFINNVFRKLGKQKFNEKIEFVSDNDKYDYKKDLERSIERIERTMMAEDMFSLQ